MQCTKPENREFLVNNPNPMQVVRALRWFASHLEQGQMEHISGGMTINSLEEDIICINSDIVLKWK